MEITICFEKLAQSGPVHLNGGNWKAAVEWMPAEPFPTGGPEGENKLVREFLAPPEAEKYRSFYRNSRRQQEMLLTRVLAKRLICGYLAGNRGFHLDDYKEAVIHHVEMGERQGMPYVSTGDNRPDHMAVSLAHCGKMLGAAVGEGCLIGIDVEEVRTAGVSFLELFLNEEEIQWMKSSFQGLDFDQKSFLMWCAKEAVGKALGTGFSQGFASIRFLPAGEEGLLKLKLHAVLAKYIPTSDAQSRIYYHFNEGTCCVICVITNDDGKRCFLE